jgi:hypothetical protein
MCVVIRILMIVCVHAHVSIPAKKKILLNSREDEPGGRSSILCREVTFWVKPFISNVELSNACEIEK